MPQDLPAILLTRPRTQADRFAGEIRRRFGAEIGPSLNILISPLFEIIPRTFDQPLSQDQIFVFSSENGVHGLTNSCTPTGQTAYCVGDRTAAAAQAAGFTAISAKGNSADLIARILADRPSAPITYAHGATVRVDIAKALRSQGLNAMNTVVYDQHPRDLSDPAKTLLCNAANTILPVFSPLTATTLSQQLPHSTSQLHVLALSTAVADNWDGPGRVQICERPNSNSMLDLIATILTAPAP